MSNGDSIEFILSKEITYHHQGTSKQGQMLVLTAPTNAHTRHRVKLQQALHRAMANIATNKTEQVAQKDTGESTIAGSDVMMMMLTSETDMVQFHDDFRKFMCEGSCLVEGEERITAKLWDDLSPDDTDALMGEYLANFILPSSLRKQSKK